MWTTIFLITTIVFAFKWLVERIKFTAVIYYIVDKGYTAPTKESLGQCIDIVVKETMKDIIKK